MSHSIEKAKVWLGVTYPENMVEGWQEQAPDLLQGIPFAYCIHDKDKEGHEVTSADGAITEYIKKLSNRKTHVHWILYLKDIKQGTTTRKHATEIFNLLSLPGRICCPGAEACLNIEHSWNYLIHDTENARKKGKYQYPPECRITGNTFDIERYIILSEEKKLEMTKEICDYIVDYRVKDTAKLYRDIRKRFSEEYFQIYKANNAMFDRLCRGVFNDATRYITALEVPKCSICGNKEIVGHYVGPTGLYWFCSDCQETAYNFVAQMEEYEEEKKSEKIRKGRGVKESGCDE